MKSLLPFLLLLSPDDGNGGAGGGGSAPQTVPYDRFQTVVNEKNTLATEVTSLRAEVQKLSEKAATVDTLSGEVTRWKGEAEKANGKFAAFSEFSGVLGINDPDVIETFDARYRALPEKDRPTRASFVEQLRADVEKAPTLLRPWLATQTQGGGAGAGGGTERPTQPRPPGTKPTPGSAPTPPTQAEIAAIRQRCAAKNDWTEWREFKKARAGK